MTCARLACIAACAALGLAPVTASAGFYSGDDLYKTCSVPKKDKAYVEHSYECIAYITGAVDAFNTTREANKLKSCIPADVTISRLREVTLAYLEDNPRSLSAPASSLVFTATRKAWPCPAATPAKKPVPAKRKKR
ncbi:MULTISPECIES: Rap1a/Tai family immunity protein [Sphingomonadaceae]|uniref:Rap1a/Tai family immunity protein n=1 Tax=Sphingomonadaceae TaxID=41297 RepID=UPI0011571632|nr:MULTISPECIES: Rap1a/Tai family immunity protein [Sphingomonadaceae]QDK31798.1 hypothetical protein DM450_03145 [Sphingomonas sp. IC081]QSR15971.1 hypothetical protein CA833_01950 [Novosphingobium sp. KA1]